MSRPSSAASRRFRPPRQHRLGSDIHDVAGDLRASQLAADDTGGLEDHDLNLVVLQQLPRGRQSGDAPADDGDGADGHGPLSQPNRYGTVPGHPRVLTGDHALPARRYAVSLPRHHRPFVAMGAGLIAVLALGACSSAVPASSSGGGSGSSAVAPANPEVGVTGRRYRRGRRRRSGRRAEAGRVLRAVRGFRPGFGDGGANSSPSSAADIATADKLVRTASLQVQVDDVEAKAAQARQIAIAAGGSVVSENSSAVPVGDGAWTSRAAARRCRWPCPPTRWTASSTTWASSERPCSARPPRDVTATYVDTQSRITTMKAGLDQVRALLAKTTDLNQIISLETEISRRQADLDALQAQLNSLDKKVAMSTVGVTLVTAANVVVPEEDSSGFLGGLKSGWKAFLGASSGVLTVLGAVLPFAVLLAIVVVPLLWWQRRRRAQRRRLPRTRRGRRRPPAPGTEAVRVAGPARTAARRLRRFGRDGWSRWRLRRPGAATAVRRRRLRAPAHRANPVRRRLRSPRWWIAFGEHRQRRHRAARAGAGRSRRTLTSPTPMGGVHAREGRGHPGQRAETSCTSSTTRVRTSGRSRAARHDRG